MSSAACASVGARRAWDDEPAGVRARGVVHPSRRTEGCSDEACCSCPAGPVAALAAGDGERRGGPPMGDVWATRAARAAQRSARARRASAMEAVEWWWVDRRKRGSDAPLPGAPNVEFRVPQTLERFELWGACEELSLPYLPARRFPSLARRTQGTRDTTVYPGSGHLAV